MLQFLGLGDTQTGKSKEIGSWHRAERRYDAAGVGGLGAGDEPSRCVEQQADSGAVGQG
ncbi:hypothetical protein N5079_26225 [Planotetraspora sp. A-T 1434]|uniref:hypothetical protein n=1 Tax=Planotetraspora sp. A-T 1434 TaxID=2979219 RepID=UPI0021C0461A|nr:hypothetical protein [Planotetraspora sp. A-T 1434]MCT9933716.1 hypothetical protein [Planotetraspora sp. A-T 1434]